MNKSDNGKKHEGRELEQERILLEEINEELTKREDIAAEIFDSISHELRTPVVTIKAYTDMMLEGRFGELCSIQKEKLSSIKRNTDLLLEVIFKLLEKKNAS